MGADKIPFGTALLRLKQQLGVHTDKEVGALIGLTDKAMSARKARDVFPVDKLYALAANRPELGIDVDYVLTGVMREAQASLDVLHGRIHRASEAGVDSYEELRAAALQRVDERSLVDRWRQCGPRDQEAILRIVSSLAAAHDSEIHIPVTKSKKQERP